MGCDCKIHVLADTMHDKEESGDSAASPNPEDAEVPPMFVAQGGERELVEMIHRDIMDASPNIRWDDIAKLEDAKRLLQGATAISCFLFSIRAHGCLQRPSCCRC